MTLKERKLSDAISSFLKAYDKSQAVHVTQGSWAKMTDAVRALRKALAFYGR